MKRIYALVIIMLAVLVAGNAQAQTGRRFALLIGGLGGTPEYTEQYRIFLSDTRTALVDRFMFEPDDITVLAEQAVVGEDFVDDVSTAENITAAFARIADKVTARGEVYIFLFGHGSYDGEHAVLNIPRQDLTDEEYDSLIRTIDAGTVVFINTASSSGPFIARLAGPNRIVITATRSGNERNETVFPRFLVEALTSEASDSDKNGDLSLLEVFHFASERTAVWYKESGHLATEHPLMEDTGDGRGYQAADLTENEEGDRAGMTYFIDLTRTTTAAIADAGDPVLMELYASQLTVNQDITALKASKEGFPEDDYYAMLEPLLIRLARITGEIEDRQAALLRTQ